LGTVTKKQVEDIAKLKMPDLNAESARGRRTRRSRDRALDGIDVVG
jgi:hypothetical protein